MKLILYFFLLFLFVCSNTLSILLFNEDVNIFWEWFTSANLAITLVFGPLIVALFFFNYPKKI
ncbi:Uncharacterised protein [Klebsiella michiganensis]|nr:hypothetical protein RC94_02240 [Pectobacterium brasiliense]STV73528.1 Uncharacterised protein [Klebsiella michiganensis]